LDNASSRLADPVIQANHLTRVSHPAYSQGFTAADLWLFEYLKIMLEWSSFEPADELQEKVTDILMSIPTFRTVQGVPRQMW
jgi:hypothetical protein